MNRRSLNIILILLGVLGLFLLIFFLLGDEKTYSWNENFNSSSDQPYGTMFIKNLLQETRSGKFVVREKTSLSETMEDEEFRSGANYVFIGQSLFLSEEDKDALISFVYEGNNAFIAAKEIPEFISDIYTVECGNLVTFDDNREVVPTMNFFHPSFHRKYGYRYTYRYIDEDAEYNWRVFNSGLFCDSTRLLTPIGYIEPEQVNFLRIPHGKGFVYLHSNPAVFANYFMIQKEKMEYAAAIFSHLEGENTIWEEFGKVPLMGGGEDGLNSPLYYIMQQPSLKYAWWMIVAAALLYVLFAAKRTQRVIPVLEGKSNTSLEFVKMIAGLHFQNKDHLDMARKKMKYFLYFIRSKYSIHGQPVTEEMIVRLSEKSKVPLQDVQAVFKFHRLIEEGSNGVIDESRLLNFFSVIENFYKKCK
jgi:hypothetical protein